MHVCSRVSSQDAEAVGASARSLRAGLLTLVVVLASLVSHVSAGGARPTAVAVALIAAMSGLVSLVLTRRRLGVPVLAVLMLAVEAATHSLCMLLTHTSHMGHATSAVMVSHHLLAAAAAVVYLRCGEQIIWDYLRTKTDQLTSWVSVSLPCPGLLRPRIQGSFVSCLSQAGAPCWSSRGPPRP